MEVTPVEPQNVLSDRPDLQLDTTLNVDSAHMQEGHRVLDDDTKASMNSGVAFHPPTPLSALPPMPDQPPVYPTETGPSHHSHAVAIPPPPNPRRHRSGIIMSRVRASSGGDCKSNLSAIQSWGELSLGMSTIQTDEDGTRSRDRSRERRIFSDGATRSDDNEDAFWDNR